MKGQRYVFVRDDVGRLTKRKPMRSESMPHKGQATRANNSSANPRVPAAFPRPSLVPIRSVITKEIDEFKKTRNAMENGQTPSRYVATCSFVARNILLRVL